MRNTNINVLLIEDNKSDAKFVKELLNGSSDPGFEIYHVDNLKDGVRVLNLRKINVVILDLGLPDCIGLKVFRKIREKNPMVPIVVLTGFTLNKFEARQCIDDAECYMIKGNIESYSLINNILGAIEERETLERINKRLITTS